MSRLSHGNTPDTAKATPDGICLFFFFKRKLGANRIDRVGKTVSSVSSQDGYEGNMRSLFSLILQEGYTEHNSCELHSDITEFRDSRLHVWPR